MDIEELRADVREALGAGREVVELIYVDESEYQQAADAMRADGWHVTENRWPPRAGGVIEVRRPA